MANSAPESTATPRTATPATCAALSYISAATTLAPSRLAGEQRLAGIDDAVEEACAIVALPRSQFGEYESDVGWLVVDVGFGSAVRQAGGVGRIRSRKRRVRKRECRDDEPSAFTPVVEQRSA